jgi:thiamine biosynthesis lipoprotein
MLFKDLNFLKKLCVNKAFLILPFVFAALSACSSESVKAISGKTMGTTYSVKIAEKKSLNQKELKKEIDELLVEVNRQMSTYQKDSEISELNKASMNTNVEISPWFKEVLVYSLKLAEQTDGAYDPTLGPLVNLWGFGPEGSRKVPNAAQIKKAQSNIGYDKIVLSKANGKDVAIKKLDGVYVDLSSSAKGFAVDKVSELISKKGFTHHLVEIGGELRASGKKFKKDWILGVEKPTEGKQGVQLAFPLNNMSIATSGDYRNFFKEKGAKYSHTIDKKSGKPVEHKLLSVTVIDKSCMSADALATALTALGPEKAQNYAYENDLAVFLIFENSEGKLTEHSSPKFLSLTN